MTLNDVVFIDNLPKIDLHGMDRLTARIMIEDFIKENIILKQNIFVIVHGIGTGILLKETSETLKKNKNVIAYKTYYYNNGCTIVEISVDKQENRC